MPGPCHREFLVLVPSLIAGITEDSRSSGSFFAHLEHLTVYWSQLPEGCVTPFLAITS